MTAPTTTTTPRGSEAALGADVVIDTDVELQRIAGFGGINVPGWIDDLTPAQVDTAFGDGPGQIGMSVTVPRTPYGLAALPLAQRQHAQAIHGTTARATD